MGHPQHAAEAGPSSASGHDRAAARGRVVDPKPEAEATQDAAEPLYIHLEAALDVRPLPPLAGSNMKPERGLVDKIWRKLDPTRAGRHRRILDKIHKKVPACTRREYLQILLSQDLFSLLSLYHTALHTFTHNGSLLQSHLSRWDTLKSKDPHFEDAADALAISVDAFISRVSGHVTSGRTLDWKEAWRLERQAKALTRKSARFHEKWDAHRAKKEMAKSKGNHCMGEMAQAGKHVLEYNARMTSLILDLVLLRKSPQQ